MTTAVAASKPGFKHFHWPKLVIARFSGLHSSRSALIWASVFGISTASSILGFEGLYKTAASKAQLVASLGHNTGISALIGAPHRIGTVGGFTAWRSLGIP